MGPGGRGEQLQAFVCIGSAAGERRLVFGQVCVMFQLHLEVFTFNLDLCSDVGEFLRCAFACDCNHFVCFITEEVEVVVEAGTNYRALLVVQDLRVILGEAEGASLLVGVEVFCLAFNPFCDAGIRVNGGRVATHHQINNMVPCPISFRIGTLKGMV